MLLATTNMYFSFVAIETLKQVAKLVAGVELTDHIIDIVFAIFDENREFDNCFRFRCVFYNHNKSMHSDYEAYQIIKKSIEVRY